MTTVLQPDYEDRHVKIYKGHALDVLSALPPNSVQVVCTSPPYHGLRDYGTEPVTFGDGWRGSLGWEPTLEMYIDHMVEICREIRRVLREDGTFWLNLGTSFASTVSNVSDCMNRLLKKSCVFFFDSITIAVAPEGVDVALTDKRPPNHEFSGFFGAKGELVKQGDDDFSEILDFLACPTNGLSRGSACFVTCQGATPHCLSDLFNGDFVIVSDLDADGQVKFGILRATSAGAHESNNASLAIKEAGKPRTKSGIKWHPNWDAFAAAAVRKGVPDVDFVNQPIALRDGHLSFAGLLCDFTVTKATKEQVTFTSIESGFILTISDVRHLRFSSPDGSVVPYRTLYDQSIRMARRECPKQELAVPEMLKIALQEEGWICRSTIVWHKPSPMPESATDRPTKAHEYVFLLTKAARYFYDAVVVKTAREGNTHSRGKKRSPPIENAGIGHKDWCAYMTHDEEITSRNLRTVWTIPSESYKGAHFAVMPRKLVETCLLAGTSAEGCCVKCGAPWKRVLEKTRRATRPGEKSKVYKTPDGRDTSIGEGGHGSFHKNGREQGTTDYDGRHTRDGAEIGNRDPGRHVTESTTIGWKPGCKCNAGTVACSCMDPFLGSGTVAEVAKNLGLKCIGIELSAEYIELAKIRIQQEVLL